MEIITSQKWALNLFDLGKGFLVAFISAAVTGLYELIYTSIEAGTFAFPPSTEALKKIGYVAALSGLAYLVKNFATPSQTIIRPDKPTSTNGGQA